MAGTSGGPRAEPSACGLVQTEVYALVGVERLGVLPERRTVRRFESDCGKSIDIS